MKRASAGKRSGSDVRITAFSNRLERRDRGGLQHLSVHRPQRHREGAGAAASRPAAEMRPLDGLRIGANYTWLDARDRRAGRRPPHPGAAPAEAQRQSGRGLGRGPARARRVARLCRRAARYRFRPVPGADGDARRLCARESQDRLAALRSIELFGRVENGFDADYQDVVGYNSPGRSVHAGLRLRLGD